MTNLKRKSSDYVFKLSIQQLEALTEIALKQDRLFEDVVLGAIDQYIEHEKKTYADNRNPNR